MRNKRLPAEFVVPAKPVKASKPPSGADWVHEIKHDGYPADRPWDLCAKPR
jgi:ATP-dependent DNA ligase